MAVNCPTRIFHKFSFWNLKFVLRITCCVSPHLPCPSSSTSYYCIVNTCNNLLQHVGITIYPFSHSLHWIWYGMYSIHLIKFIFKFIYLHYLILCQSYSFSFQFIHLIIVVNIWYRIIQLYDTIFQTCINLFSTAWLITWWNMKAFILSIFRYAYIYTHS